MFFCLNNPLRCHRKLPKRPLQGSGKVKSNLPAKVTALRKLVGSTREPAQQANGRRDRASGSAGRVRCTWPGSASMDREINWAFALVGPLPRGWERQIVDPEAIVYSWVFHQMDGPPVTVGRQITARSSALNRASREITHAKALYRDCLDKYGSGRWVADEPIVDLLDSDLPPWMREDVEVL
jgi:hypothetical protein